jgi:ADP-dependent phosphofructokinase/glucokinase
MRILLRGMELQESVRKIFNHREYEALPVGYNVIIIPTRDAEENRNISIRFKIFTYKSQD